MKPRKLLATLAVLSSFGNTVATQATTISRWTFETSIPTTAGPISPEVGSGYGTAYHANAASYSNPAGNGSSESWSATQWSVGDYWQFQISTLGFENISVAWDQTGSAGGPASFGFFWSATGLNGSFTQIGGDYAVPQPVSSWSTYVRDLSSLSEFNDAPTLYFRLVDLTTARADGGTSSVTGSGTDRIDNFTVTGTELVSNTVPDSLPLGLAASALFGMVLLGQKHRQKLSRC